MTALTERDRNLAEARAYPPGSLDWLYRIRAAWTLDRMARGVAVIEWDDPSPQELAAWANTERMEIAA